MTKIRFVLPALAVLLGLIFPARVRADAASEAWFKGAYDALQKGTAGAGKVPVVYATITLVSTEPADAIIGKAPERTGVWYASGEVTRVQFPLTTRFEGKFPMFINSGPLGAPFPSGPATLGVSVDEKGAATLHYQVDGRNRMGKGPQQIQMGVVPSGSDAKTQMFSAATSFFGRKLIVLSLVLGEKDAPKGAPAPPKQALGTRYRVSPVFVVTNSNDGIGDGTIELGGDIGIYQAGEWKLWIQGLQGDGGKGKRFNGTPFEIETRSAKKDTLGIKITGKLYDKDEWGSDIMWTFDRTLSLESLAGNKKLGKIASNQAIPDNDATGYLEMNVEKIGDIY